ncbi:MAG: prolyl oligopeptidase family serine peptidase [Phycisphaerales bacterium]|nr:prolyl oligopeptidase family serine peptidase [Phycisphaerales bacterium]
MPWFDMPLEQLKQYVVTEAAPPDFDVFWQGSLSDSAKFDLLPQFTPFGGDIYRQVRVWDVSFSGFMGQRIKGWLLLPPDRGAKYPCVVSYVGYTGGRGLPVEHLALPVAGIGCFVMDTRGQGCSSGSTGDTPDEGVCGPQRPGFMTRGIESRESYFYRRVFTDAVRAVEAAAAHPEVDSARIGVAGASQGGGISIATAALSPRVKLLMADVAFLCHYQRAVTLVDTSPYNEISHYLKAHRHRVDMVFNTLAYFDGIHFAPRIKARALFSVALMDDTCPPSTGFAVYNRITAPKEMKVYPFNNHEGGGAFQVLERLQFAKSYL